ncbi:uncharacterized protein V6R79_010653 [Siganus canaliculatus]
MEDFSDAESQQMKTNMDRMHQLFFCGSSGVCSSFLLNADGLQTLLRCLCSASQRSRRETFQTRDVPDESDAEGEAGSFVSLLQGFSPVNVIMVRSADTFLRLRLNGFSPHSGVSVEFMTLWFGLSRALSMQ